MELKAATPIDIDPEKDETTQITKEVFTQYAELEETARKHLPEDGQETVLSGLYNIFNQCQEGSLNLEEAPQEMEKFRQLLSEYVKLREAYLKNRILTNPNHYHYGN